MALQITQEEIWKDIEGYEGIYQISNTGKVKSLPKEWWTGRHYIKTPTKILKPSLDRKGYLKITLCKNTHHVTYRLHRLLATAFIPKVENKNFINHVDGNKINNNLSNLEWVTSKENNKHAQDTGLNPARYSQKQKEACKQTGLKNRKNIQMPELGDLYFVKKWSITKIAKYYGHSRDAVNLRLRELKKGGVQWLHNCL